MEKNENELKELRRQLAEDLQDPRDLYREEIIEDVTFVAKLIQANQKWAGEFLKFLSSWFWSIHSWHRVADEEVPIEVVILELLDYYFDRREPAFERIAKKDSFLKEELNFRVYMKEMTSKIINVISDLPLRNQLLRIDEIVNLGACCSGLDYSDKAQIENFIDFYGVVSEKRDEFFSKTSTYPISMVKISEGVYRFFDYDCASSCEILKETKEKLIEGDCQYYLEIILRRGAKECNSKIFGDHYSETTATSSFLNYIILKSLENDNSSEIELLSGCGEYGCGLDYTLRENYAESSVRYIETKCKQRLTGNGDEHPKNEELLKKIKQATGWGKPNPNLN